MTEFRKDPDGRGTLFCPLCHPATVDEDRDEIFLRFFEGGQASFCHSSCWKHYRDRFVTRIEAEAHSPRMAARTAHLHDLGFSIEDVVTIQERKYTEQARQSGA